MYIQIGPTHTKTDQFLPRGHGIEFEVCEIRRTHRPFASCNTHGLLASSYGVFCVVLGFVIVGVHINASNINDVASLSCKSHLNPWFTSQYACSLINVNCYRRGIQGNDTQVTEIRQEFDPKSVRSLIFTQCPALEVPSAIRGFSNLVGIGILNSTLVAWTTDAAIDASTHPQFNYLMMGMGNLIEIPEGLHSVTISQRALAMWKSHTPITAHSRKISEVTGLV